MQEVFQTLHNNLQWLNPNTWFEGLNLHVWVMGVMGYLLIIVVFCALKHIYKIVFRGSYSRSASSMLHQIYHHVCHNKQERERCWGPLRVVLETVAPLSKALEGANNFPGKPGNQVADRPHTNTEGSWGKSDLEYTLYLLTSALPSDSPVGISQMFEC